MSIYIVKENYKWVLRHWDGQDVDLKSIDVHYGIGIIIILYTVKVIAFCKVIPFIWKVLWESSPLLNEMMYVLQFFFYRHVLVFKL